MSNLGILVPIAIFTVGPASYAFTTWVRAKHGYPLESRHDFRRNRRMGRWHPMGMMMGAPSHGGEEDGETLASTRKIELLSSENERLTGQIGRLEERLRVLERIATDPAERTAREIDALRD